MTNQRGFVIPPFLLSPTGIMATTIVVLSISNLVFFKLWRSAVDDFTTYRAKVEAAQKQAEADAEKARLESERITKDVSDSWAAALDHLRRNPVVRVLPARCDLPQAGAVPAAGQVADGPTTESGSGATISYAECESRVNKAVVDAAQVLYLQDWIYKQREATK